MRVEVDSSGLWGKTSEPTVFAFSDSGDRAIWIAPVVKQACLQEVRAQRGRTTVNEYVRLYAIGVFLCLRPHLDRFSEIVLDVEFAGRMDQVISTLFEQMVVMDPRHAMIRVRASGSARPRGRTRWPTPRIGAIGRRMGGLSGISCWSCSEKRKRPGSKAPRVLGIPRA